MNLYVSIDLRLLVLVVGILFIKSVTLSQLYGEIVHTVQSDTEIFQWNINPTNPTASSIQFVFQSLNMPLAELRIYDRLSINIY